MAASSLKARNSRPAIVIGFGRLGQSAVKRLFSLGFGRLTVVDNHPSAMAGLSDEVVKVQGSGPTWLAGQSLGQSWIIPALPVHLAAYWLKEALRLKGRAAAWEPVDQPAFASLPHLSQTKDRGLLASWADFLCPDDCEEKGPCPRLGVSLEPLYLRLRALAQNQPLGVVRSYQLAPGLGGYPARSLRKLLEFALARREGELMVATACRCHAVIHSLKVI